MLEIDRMGAFNVIRDQETYTMQDVIETAINISGSGARPVYTTDEFLLNHKVGPWMELPLCLPESHINMSLVSATKAVSSGLNLMPLEDVVSSTLDWFQNLSEQDWPAGLAAEKEAASLAEWDKQS
jgi:2'-hydroxyisoflavone reductase